ncbi:MAG TPA: hypothetical protein VLT45_25370, partial [Kofleriaceae bacterium]|nr:hypothetical protein [Kofleriaceae bacterium]
MKPWLLVLAAGCSSTPAGPGVFEIGEWTDITGNPDLGALSSPDQQSVDFGIWKTKDGSWHIWECIRFTQVGGHTRLFYGWHAATPTGPWTADGIVMQADPSVGEAEGGLRAPFVLDDGTRYRMFYGTWDNLCEQTSSD